MEKNGKTQTGLVSRPPIVAVLGHVDHGKTSLLDKIRQTKVAEKETGGITQKIGAYQVDLQGKKITFIDTPGHEAFSAMRSRGAKVADIAVLVVSATDGVMPQTIESINHIQSAKIPFIVAINKIDLPSADVERIKEQLSQNGVNTEDYGGDIVCVPVSAKTGDGVKDLLDMILLLAEMNNVEADPNGEFLGIIIESNKNQRGSVGTVIVRNGTLKIGDIVQTPDESFRVKGMFDQEGKGVATAEPGKPIEVLGFVHVPAVGAEITSSVASSSLKATGNHKEETFSVENDNGQEKIRMIIKADSQGSLEAVTASLPTEVLILGSSIGDVTDSEVLLARSSRAEIWGFNVKVPTQVERLAESEHVNIYTFKIIYEFLEKLEGKILKFIEPTIDEQILGKAEIIARFDINGQAVAGCRVLENRINKSDNLHLKRGEKIVADTKITSLKHRKEEINEVIKGDEFGVVFSGLLDFKIGDVIIAHK